MWRCRLCNREGVGDAVDFYKHYVREHYEQTTYAAGDGYRRARSKPEAVREVRDRLVAPLESPPQKTSGDGRVEGPGDQLTGEPDPALW